MHQISKLLLEPSQSHVEVAVTRLVLAAASQEIILDHCHLLLPLDLEIAAGTSMHKEVLPRLKYSAHVLAHLGSCR